MNRKLISMLVIVVSVVIPLQLPFVVASVAYAQAPLPSLTQYTQDFDTLASSGTSSTVPTGWAFSESGTNANTAYTAGTGSGNTGDTFSFGATSSTERAFGGLRTGNLVPTIGVQFQNNTGGTIGRLVVQYNCEQWRIGVTNRGAADRMDFQYSMNATSLTTGTWTDVDALDCVSTVTSGTAGALNGNTNRTLVSSTITGLSISSGVTFWLRWTDFDITSSDDGLAIDDFSMTGETPNAITLRALTAAPAPLSPLTALPILGLAALGGLTIHRRRTARP